MACFVYCLLGTSKDVNLGPAAVMSLLTAEFGHSVIHDDATYAIALSLVCGVFQIIMGVLHVGQSSTTAVTGQLADTPTRGLVNSRTRQLAYWTSRGLDNSRMPPATLRA